jgi:regulator of nucleoside diphosphate kinase
MGARSVVINSYSGAGMSVVAAQPSEIISVWLGKSLDDRSARADREMVARLVYPEEEALDEPDRVSIFTPEGAVILGLSEGRTIEYETRDGRRKTLTVLDVQKSVGA